jgi:predicted amidohydrolase YtcJ
VLLIRQAEIIQAEIISEPVSIGPLNIPLQDVRCRNGKITEIGTALKPRDGELVVNAKGGALVPGLHDHHMHLMALAAAQDSVPCGPPTVNNVEDLRQKIASVAGNGWIIGTGYHESVSGMLDRFQLDQIVADRPLRIQHRSGKMWFVNSSAAKLLKLDQHLSLSGIECDSGNVPTGRLFRMDKWLRDQLHDEKLPDVRSTSRLLASYGVTGITDATPGNSASTREHFQNFIEKGDILQRVLMMGDESLQPIRHEQLETGALKILLDDYNLPEFIDLTNMIDRAHQQHRCVAIHCVTEIELVFALSALIEAGSRKEDRIEHASVTSDDHISLLQKAGATVVTQPNFIAERGDNYIADVDVTQHALLYRCKAFLNAQVPLGGGTDAPFGNPDPWLAIRAAVNRRTVNGKSLGSIEQLTAEEALQLFTSVPTDPGGRGRSMSAGQTLEPDPEATAAQRCGYDCARW